MYLSNEMKKSGGSAARFCFSYLLAQPVIRVLRDALKIPVVGVDETEARIIAVAPLEVVRERPVEPAAHVRAVFNRAAERREVAREEIYALRVANPPVHAHHVGAGDAVFG